MKHLRYILLGLSLAALVALSFTRAYALLEPAPSIAPNTGYEPIQTIEEIEALNESISNIPVSDRPADTPSPIFAPSPAGGAPVTIEQQKLIDAADAAKENKPATGDKPNDPEKEYGCNWPWNVKACYIEPLANVALWLSSRLLWIAGILLNMSVHYTLNMSELLKSLPIVDIGWTIIRDIANIVFIFIALWSGISITLGVKADKAWGLLANMVLVALFINFSLFITKAVVDASNVAALHFYSLIKQPGSNAYDGGLSDAFMSGLNIQSLYNTSQLERGELTGENVSYVRTVGKGNAYSTVNLILIGVFGSFFMVVAAWVFFMAAIMFIIRAVVLIMLMILSPLAFVGLLLPGASGMAHEWWSKLWSQAFFAPLYLALAYIVVATINSPGFQGIAVMGAGPTSFAAAFTGFTSSSVLIVLNFVILIGFMVACLVVAQSMGAKGSAMAMSGFAKITHLAGAAAGGVLRTGLRTPGIIGEKIGARFAHKEEEFKKEGRQLNLLQRGWMKMGKGLGTAGKWTDIRYIDERFKQTRFGNWGIGKVLRESTTGALAHAKIGTKSLWETYEEAETQSSERRDITLGKKSKDSADALAQEQAMHDGRKKEQKAAVDKAKNDLENARAYGAGPQQIAEAEAKLRAEQIKYEALANPAAAKESAAKNTRDAQDNLNTAGAGGSAAQIAAAQAELRAAQELEQAVAGIAEVATRSIAEQNRLTGELSTALARMTVKGFLNLPKHYFTKNGVMDPEVLGADKYGALMASEHFTEQEKQEYTHARLERYHGEQKELEEAHKEWLKDWKKYQKELSEYNKKKEDIEKKLIGGSAHSIQSAQAQLKAAQEQLGNLKKAKAPAAAIAAQEGVVTGARNDLAAARGRAKPELDALGKAPAAPDAPTWQNDALRKSLRNIRNTDELVNYYRYDPGIFDFKHFSATIMQGQWDRMRESDKIDSVFKEKGRVNKRYYIQEASDLQFGLDPELMSRWDAINASAAREFRATLNSFLKKNGTEAYAREFFDGGKLNALIAQSSMKSDLGTAAFGGEDAASVDERKLRRESGKSMYTYVASNLSYDEFNKMPGALRNLQAVWDGLDQSTVAPFENRDIEDTLLMAEFFIDQFRREILEQGRISEGNLNILKWIVNEDRGQRFTRINEISEEHKKTFEIIKALIAATQRSLRSTIYSSAEEAKAAIESLRTEAGLTGSINPFDRIRNPNI